MRLSMSNMESPYIQGHQATPHESWNALDLVENKKIWRFSFCIDVKADGRIHYTGVRAEDHDGEVIFFSKWGESGQWETQELAQDEVVIGFHGYLHMEW